MPSEPPYEFNNQLDCEALIKYLKSSNANPEEVLSSIFRQKGGIYNQALIEFVTRQHTDRFNYLSKERPNFYDYMISKNKANDIPTNCTHVSIAYHIYRQQEGVKPDPTQTGRDIRRAHMIVS